MTSVLFTDTMDLLHENSVSAIESLQTRFHYQSNIFFMISNIFDPRYAFLFISPLVFSLDWTAGKKVMLVSVIAEWSNQILKWMLHGERPYWWIHETAVYNRTGIHTPDIQQFSLTCETGPGSPSGHSMVTAAVFYVIFESFLRKTGAVTKTKSNYLIEKACWIVYSAMLLTVSTSRVYIAAHFPHQCLLGIAIGCFVAMAMNNVKTDKMSSKHYIIGTIALLGSALATFAALKAMGLNPSWSVDRAVKWCAKQEYIHVDTTPFFSMMRYCGFFLGMGLGLTSQRFTALSNVKFSMSMKMFAAFLAVGMSKLSERIDLPKGNMMAFYATVFILYTILPYVTIAVIPSLVHKIWAKKEKFH